MAHANQDRYAKLVLAKLHATLVTQDKLIFNNTYEGEPKAGVVKIPVRDTEVSLRDYNRATGLTAEGGTTTYMDLAINKDKAVNEIIDGYDAQAVPDGIVAERLDSAGYAIGLGLDKEGIQLLETGGTAIADTVALTNATVYEKIVAARTALSKANVPVDMRFLIVTPEVMGLLLRSDEFVKSGDLSQELVASGVIGRVAGFNVFESSNFSDAKTEFVAGHPNWAHRVIDWKVNPYIQDLSGDAAYIGASAVKGRLVYGYKISRAIAYQVKKKA